MTNAFERYYGCPAALSPSNAADAVREVWNEIACDGDSITQPFDVDEVVDNLRLERYVGSGKSEATGHSLKSLVRSAYYLLRPLMPVSVRKHLQRLSLRGWDQLAFPRWPVDCTVDLLMEELLKLTISARGPVPFIWFWPDGLKSCAIVTHDVETKYGRDNCERLMDVDGSFGIRSSFQIIPEGRYVVPDEFLESIRSRGFEINVHDYNHDGKLYSDRKTFEMRSATINEHAKRFGAKGFRSAVLYRNLDWYDSFEFAYDMSVPNVAHLDPQHGGCCTVMPYFIGEVLELPLTTTQDYSLFNILQTHSIDLWKKQVETIRARHGMASFNVHPDYLDTDKAMGCYEDLLSHLSSCREAGDMWFALPREVDEWWRMRDKMMLVSEHGQWRIEGNGSERATVVFAAEDGGRLVYRECERS